MDQQNRKTSHYPLRFVCCWKLCNM